MLSKLNYFVSQLAANPYIACDVNKRCMGVNRLVQSLLKSFEKSAYIASNPIVYTTD